MKKAEVIQTVIIPERSVTDRTAAIGLVEAVRKTGVVVRVSLGEPSDLSGNLYDTLTPVSQPQPQSGAVKAAG